MESRLKATGEATAAQATGAGAATRAIAEARRGLEGEPALVLAFPSGIGPAELAEQLAEAGPGSVAGLSGNGAIGEDGPVEQGCAAIALGGATRAAVAAALPGEGMPLRAAAHDATRDALAQLGPGPGHAAVLLLLDTRTGDQSEAIAGAYAAAGPTVPLAGGAAGGAAPCQIAPGGVLERAVVAVALRRPGPIGVGTAHGCRPVGPPAIVTRSEGRRILELNGAPAVREYLGGIGFGEIEHGADSEFEALAVTHPLAQPELNGDERVRHVLGRDGDALVCATHIPENAAVFFTSETPNDVVATAGQAVSEALAGLGGRPAQAALIFDCAGRKAAAAGSITHEVESLLGAFGPRRPPLAGLFTHGEVARIRGAKGDRNHAIVVVALA